MISEILKKLDIKTTPFLVAVLVVLVTARFWYAQSSVLLELFIILLSVYLFIIFISWCFSAIHRRMQNEECQRNESRKKAAKNEQTYEQIWNFFLGLSNQRMQMLFDLIKLPEAGSKYKRVVQPNTKLKNQLACDDSFKIRFNFDWYLPLLIISCNYEPDAPMVVDIDPTLYDFTEHYMITGKKERI